MLRRLLSAALCLAVIGGPLTSRAHASLPTLRFGAVIDDAAPYEPQTSCASAPQPGTVALRRFVLRAFPGTADLGILTPCRPGDVSEHHEGRAWDWGVRAWVPQEQRDAEQFLQWLLAPDAYGHDFAMARRLGVMYVIWDRRIWGTYAPGWRPYQGVDPHRTHIHISLSWAGARRLTSFYSGRAYLGQPAGPPAGLAPQPAGPGLPGADVPVATATATATAGAGTRRAARHHPATHHRRRRCRRHHCPRSRPVRTPAPTPVRTPAPVDPADAAPDAAPDPAPGPAPSPDATPPTVAASPSPDVTAPSPDTTDGG